MFYERTESATAIKQDLTLEVACHVTDMKVDIIPEYYRSKKWYSQVPSVSERAHTRARELIERSSAQHLSLQEVEPSSKNQTHDVNPAWKRMDSQDGEWHSYFKDQPYSNRTTRELLPAALEATSLAMKRGKCGIVDLPFRPLFCTGSKVKKQVHFYYGPVSNIENIRSALAKCGKEPQLLNMLYELMEKQQVHLNSRTRKDDDLYFSKIDGDTVETTCPCGNYR
ncbi:uncharacterized protein KY384_007975 [Bacidia gigantensis]|uniref:uncharacterized protein n=1 Tax=Bacidia gigantensis TaxID=2732470 RepID=UPI001D048831|nr:uncharacterized protein KY384_007975 [Bacidia gigantensis]KAG8527821.1 hypothetical protein KY384_007975 [Bacidia gigantensis]